MTSQERKLRRAYWRKALGPVVLTFLAIVLGIILAGYVRSLSELPVVYKALPGKVVGCASKDTRWQMVDANTTVCKDILSGQYEIEWVSPS